MNKTLLSVTITLTIILVCGAFSFKKILTTNSYQRQVVDAQNDVIRKMERILNKEYQRTLIITAYTASEDETDDTPFVNAFMNRVVPGYDVAVSRNLLWSGWAPGMKLYVEDLGVRRIADVLSKRSSDHVDLLVWTKEEARQIGISRKRVTLIW